MQIIYDILAGKLYEIYSTVGKIENTTFVKKPLM